MLLKLSYHNRILKYALPFEQTLNGGMIPGWLVLCAAMLSDDIN
jgi:hypothetical protein